MLVMGGGESSLEIQTDNGKTYSSKATDIGI